MAQVESSQFGSRAEKVIRDHVRSVLLVDDEWPDESLTYPVHTPVATSPTFGNGEAVEADLDRGAEQQEEAPDESDFVDNSTPETPVASPLLKVRKSVIDEGMLFTGVRYVQTERNNVDKLASNADIIVLDWELLHNDAGAEALEFLKRLADKGLRFVCVFTGATSVERVGKAISDKFGQSGEGMSLDRGVFRLGHLVVVVRTKGWSDEVNDDTFSVSAEDIVEMAIKGMSAAWSGFLQLALLELTAAHRNALPEVLAKFGPEYDSAFLLEATNEDSPVGEGDVFVGLLLDEWKGRLQGKQFSLLSSEGISLYCSELKGVARCADKQAYSKRLQAEEVNAKDAERCAEDMVTHDGRKAIEKWLESGAKGVPILTNQLSKPNQAKARGALFGCFCEGECGPGLSGLDALFHQRSSKASVVTQGTVLRVDGQEGVSARYLICITPLCDAARHAGKIDSVFTFLLAEKWEATTKHTGGYCVLREGTEPLHLHVRSKPIVALRIPEPVSDDGGAVIAYPWSPVGIRPSTAEEPVGTAETPGLRLVTVAQLRSEHALAMTAMAGAAATRVGVDRVEVNRGKYRVDRED
jgi:hypothetical protein